MSDAEFTRLIADIRRSTRIVRIATFVLWAIVGLQLGAVVAWLVL